MTTTQQDGSSPKVFEIGPDLDDDIRSARSYFLVPLLEPTASPGEAAPLQHYRDRIINYIQESAGSYSDVYLFSHGWHRNFFSAVSAYDRLISRMFALGQRGRLIPRTEPYRPLFIALHWHSDPHEDGWVDEDGRRDKTSFMTNAAGLFEPAPNVCEGAFINTLEDIYEFFTFVSAPDVSALNPSLNGRGSGLLQALGANCQVRGVLAGTPPVGPGDMAALAWRCYQEADAMRVLVDQSVPPHRFDSPLNALSNLAKFLIAVLGVSVLVASLRSVLTWLGGSAIAHALRGWILGFPTVAPLWHLWRPPLVAAPIREDIAFLAAVTPSLAVVAGCILFSTVAYQRAIQAAATRCNTTKPGARGIPVLAVGSWLPLQILFALPLVGYLFATYLFRSVFIAIPAVIVALLAWWNGNTLLAIGSISVGILLALILYVVGAPVGGLFNERLTIGTDGISKDTAGRVRDGLAWFARLPMNWLCQAIARDSQVMPVLSVIDKQLAFWQMQRKGVRAGDAAGRFLADLLQELDRRGNEALDQARLHLVGHSFGSLVVTNLARRLAWYRETLTAKTPKLVIHTLSLLEAAISSDWFAREPWASDPKFLTGSVSSVYSRYDSANGFYYPAANNARASAGYVGMCAVGSNNAPIRLGHDGLFASLVQPPDLQSKLDGASAPFALNLDASRLIYFGNIAQGGGHDDIFKDDVIHLLWAVSGLESEATTQEDKARTSPLQGVV